MTERLRIVFRPEADGWWSVSSPDEVGLATQGKSLKVARRRAREGLSTLWEDWPRAERAVLLEEFVLPKSVLKGLASLHARRKELAESQERASRDSRKLARALVKRGLGMRDAGDLLALSHQRIAQLIAD